MRDPVFYLTPGIQHHVVDAIGDHFAEVFHLFGLHAVHDEHAAGDDVGGAVGQHAAGIHRACGEFVELHPAALVAETADKDARAQHRCILRAHGNIGERGVNG